MELGGSSVDGESRRRWGYIGGGHYFLTADRWPGINARRGNMGDGLVITPGAKGCRLIGWELRRIALAFLTGAGEQLK